jgi:peptide/nickel transport system permease protein
VKNKKLIFGGAVVTILFLLGLFAPLLAHQNPNVIVLEDSLCAPSGQHIFGCDANGADLFALVLYGASLSLRIGLIVTFISLTIGLILGSIAGYLSGWRDALLMRVLDVVFAFPGSILAIALASMLGPSEKNLVICLAATGWAGYTRLVRAEVMNLRNREYVEAARSLGLPAWRIVVRHIWPNIASPLLVAATFGFGGVILAEAGLSFLGIGVPPGTPSWGSVLNAGRDVLLEAPHVATVPGVAVMLAVLGFNFVGEGLREKLDTLSKT